MDARRQEDNSEQGAQPDIGPAGSLRLAFAYRGLLVLAFSLVVLAAAGLIWRIPQSDATPRASSYGVTPAEERPLALADSQVRALFRPAGPRADKAASPATAVQTATPPLGAVAPSASGSADARAGPGVAIVLTEVGEDERVTPAMLSRLPPAIGIAVTPNARHSAAYAAAALAAGHQLWAGIPMQPTRYPAVTPGPRLLLLTASAEENRATVLWALDRVPGAIGAYNIMGSAITADPETLGQVIDILKERRLLFLDTRSTGATVSARLGAAAGLNVTLSDRFLDETPAPAAIDSALDDLAALARRRGRALGVMHADPASLARLEKWLPTLETHHVSLVQASVKITTLK